MSGTLRTLFSYDPKVTPECACPDCGWQTFWEITRGTTLLRRCEWCGRYPVKLVRPEDAPTPGVEGRPYA